MLTTDSLKPTLIDTHAHLDSSDYRADRAAVIARAFSESIGVVTVGVDLPTSEEAVCLANRHRTIWAAIGVHPHDAKTLDQEILSRLEALAKDPRVVAIGEIGLDYYRDLSPRGTQRSAFSEQIGLARELNLPIIVHNRESTKDLLSILRHHGSSYRGVIHSFLGDSALAEEFLSLGFHLGIGGPVTFNKNEILRETVRELSLDRILLETDCPYLTPVPHRGKRNEPVYLRYVAAKVAELKGIPVCEVEERTTRNAIHLFSLSS
jgi:TatD DNase family protein